jgi:hypothetical protein
MVGCRRSPRPRGGSVFEGVEFTSQHGTWKQNGARALIATVIDFGLGTDTAGGTVVATYELSFGRGFDTVEGVITLLNFAPGVNPFADDAKPIDDPVREHRRGQPGRAGDFAAVGSSPLRARAF